ncbi:Putative lipoprotein/NMB1162 [Klebsiella spallanzanii]|jgi:hypothetical protein|uniref:Lipoprotein/NMB1162 n=1 Tax=Klebsiella spallanzanii TaxID=2587528 RepID=A0A564JLY6_9ENTR|nr:DUF799 domain-containing protein [Klebsiella spallanzanii]MDM4207361.1 DUF799 domain-containing protein [Klebsiella spallanzanii]VUS57905.1 Putative lipoprotein/NMB1162 [Klebsiella spallanzanii]VUS66203.1 Putative lipoprotein/NMB1162 [Klebsiella spallanzanii]
MKKLYVLCAGLLLTLLLSGCAPKKSYDYTAFRQSKPKSILVLLPKNESPDVKAGYGVLSQVTLPLAEAGYYVFPVAVVENTFKQNGVVNGEEMHSVSRQKLGEIFGADAVLYLKVTEYGTSYQVISSATRVAVSAELVDIRNGQLLWNGSAVASSSETDGSGGSLLGMLIQAAVDQIVNTLTDRSYKIAGIADARLLTPGAPDGILYGPRSPKYGKDLQ